MPTSACQRGQFMLREALHLDFISLRLLSCKKLANWTSAKTKNVGRRMSWDQWDGGQRPVCHHAAASLRLTPVQLESCSGCTWRAPICVFLSRIRRNVTSRSSSLILIMGGLIQTCATCLQNTTVCQHAFLPEKCVCADIQV